MKIRLFHLLVIVLIQGLISESLLAKKMDSSYLESSMTWEANEEVKECIHDPTPYLLPRDHYLRSILDTIFSNPALLKNKKSFSKGRFTTIALRKKKGSLRVARHPSAPGYLFKLYLKNETEKSSDEVAQALIQRCVVAKRVGDLIKQQGIRHITVPEKWLYEIARDAKSDERTFVLVVRDMQLSQYKGSVKAWKKVATEEHLHELYAILSSGYASVALAQNIPYTKSNTFSCIDTEFAERNFRLARAKRYFSNRMKKYWMKLIVDHKFKKKNKIKEEKTRPNKRLKWLSHEAD